MSLKNFLFSMKLLRKDSYFNPYLPVRQAGGKNGTNIPLTNLTLQAKAISLSEKLLTLKN